MDELHDFLRYITAHIPFPTETHRRAAERKLAAAAAALTPAQGGEQGEGDAGEPAG